MTCIDIVIPCAGRASDLLRLLASIRRECAVSLPALCASITVTDDRPSAALAQAVADTFAAVRYVHGPARGPAANRNHGARFGQAAWILFLDDDCYLDGDLLQAYMQRLAACPQADVVEGAIHSVGERPNGNHHAPLNRDGGCLWSCNMLVQRQLFASVGGFDEDFPFACMEDVDLHERLRRAGATIPFAPSAVVRHPWRSISEREVSRQIVSHAIYADKHPAFARGWDLTHTLRLAAGRRRLYSSPRLVSIPWAKYRTVVYDMAAPLLLFAVVRFGPLRRWLRARYSNARAQTA